MSNLQQLRPVKPEEYRTDNREHIFRSAESLRWTMRQHLPAFIEAGAVVYPTNRPLIIPDKFDQVVQTIGEANARARLARCGS